MRFLKGFLVILLVLVALLAGIGMLLPRTVSVSRSAVIPAPQWQVYAPVADLTQWDQWAKWNQIDPNMKVTYGAVKMGEGASYSWESDHSSVGNGAMRIVSTQGMDELQMEMDFQEQGTASSSFTLTPTAEGTGVTWSMTTDMGAGPIGRWFGLMMDDLIGADFEEGLANLEAYVTESPASMEIQRVKVPSKHVLLMTETAKIENVEAALERCFQKVNRFAEQAGAIQDGAPFAMYDYKEDGQVVITAGIPIQTATEGSMDVTYTQFPETVALKANYYGDPQKVQEAYTLLAKEVDKFGAELANTAGPMGWEEYQEAESATPDRNLLTEVYVPIRQTSTQEMEEVAN